MKKLILLSLATMITFSASAQIEMYKEEQQVQVQVKKKSWQEKKKEYLDSIQQNTKYPLLNLSDNRYLIGDTLYSVRNEEERTVFVLISTNDSIRVSKLPVGEYFQVIDMIVCKEERDSLFNSFNNKTFVEEKKSFRRMVQVGTEELFLGFTKPIKAPIWEAMYKSVSPIYVLKKNDTIYYAECFEGYGRRGFYYKTSDFCYLADISDFVSVKSYNMLKDMYVGKEFVSIYTPDIHGKKDFIRQVEASSIWTIEKLLLKGTDFYTECASDNQEKKGKIEEVEDTLYISNNFCKHSVPAYVDATTVDTFSVFDIRFGSDYHSFRDFILKSEADALITKWKYEEEQNALAEKKRQTQYKNDIIKKYGEKYGSLILQGKICVGMTKEMCIEAKGTPCKKNKSSDKYGTIEVWTYNCLDVEWALELGLSANYTFVTFKNGKITDITE